MDLRVAHTVGVLLAIALATGAGCCAKTPPIVPTTSQPAVVTASTVVSRVSIDGSGFTPRTVTVRSGDTVIWTNNDHTEHNVGGSGLVSGVIPPGGTFAHTFDAAGTYQYLCTFHPDTEGQVVVAAR